MEFAKFTAEPLNCERFIMPLPNTFRLVRDVPLRKKLNKRLFPRADVSTISPLVHFSRSSTP